MDLGVRLDEGRVGELLGSGLLASLSAFILNFFCPDVPARRLIWLAATIPPLLIAFYVIRFIVTQVSEAEPGMAPLAFMAAALWWLLGAAAIGVALAVGYLASRIVLTVLRRS